MITQKEISAHAEAEEWLWEAEVGHEAGPFWRRFVVDLFRVAVRKAARSYS